MKNYPAWFLDEAAHAGREHLDADYVAGYDRKAGTDPEEDLALLLDLGLDKTSTLVDLGAGTGTFALAAARHCRRVVAVDPSPAMLAAVRQKSEQLGLQNIECIEHGFLTYEHTGAPADVVYSRNALHHLPDFWKAVALERIARIVKPGGVLRLRDLIFSFPPDQAEAVIEGWLTSAASRHEDGWTAAEYEHHLREEFSTFTWLLEPMLEQAGFELRAASYSDSRIYAAYTCVR